MIRHNYHTHTKRCGHATGEDEEYVLAAIQAGVKTLGFSDHAPYDLPHPSERMDITQVQEYYDSVHALQKKYKDQIDIHLGMEVECYTTKWDILSQWRKDTDYCILGQHNLDFEAQSSYDLTNVKELNTYCDRLEFACKHGLCDYIAHPDVCLYSYPVLDEGVRAVGERIATISSTYHMPLELNCGSGVRYGKSRYEDGYRYAYPTRIFFEEFAKKNCDIIIGLDIHDPSLFSTDEYIQRALSVIEGLPCHIIENYPLIEEAKKRKKLFY